MRYRVKQRQNGSVCRVLFLLELEINEVNLCDKPQLRELIMLLFNIPCIHSDFARLTLNGAQSVCQHRVLHVDALITRFVLSAGAYQARHTIFNSRILYVCET